MKSPFKWLKLYRYRVVRNDGHVVGEHMRERDAELTVAQLNVIMMFTEYTYSWEKI